MKKITLALALTSIITLTACTDATMGKLTSLGDSASVKCWSGGTLIFDGKSTGKVQSEKSSDGYFFKDAKDNKFKEVSGNCVITYD
tara:strand:- start:17616 stop:17873 length:258 start_codon:yes stop_codon:yes gene_type:complete